MSAIKKIWNGMVNLSPTGKIATSLIMKDAVGCCLYVTQARSNKQFTPQQRSDVANYDLANGVINIGLQLLAVKPIENLMTKFVESKMINKMFTNLDERLKDTDSDKVMKLLKNKKNLTAGVVAVFSVLICQYFIKRVISPFFSVPVGEKSKQIGLIKPTLYGDETYNPKGDSFEKIKDTVVNTYDKVENSVVNTYNKVENTVVNTYDKVENQFESIKDKFEKIEDKFEDKFELQNDDD